MTTNEDPTKEQPPLETLDIQTIGRELGELEFNIEKERFVLAKWILLCLFLSIVSLTIYRLSSETADKSITKEIFDTVFHSVVPIISLIIGYYFGSKDNKE
ncbi:MULTISPECIES: hypothetical protein [Morganellaceae]|uniref:hypothetical protein n=1 Tax=Morganellaceae TaxID=1903414 RepID=UPI001BAE5E9B|nr:MULTISPECIES: hypothetical protein [Morganellaceae]MBS3857586.1 hypothetical protein [Proteus mirabilis]MCT0090467.1 hypothetical protein [Proteus mirabilis]